MTLNQTLTRRVVRRLCRPLPVAAIVTAVGVVQIRRIINSDREAKQWEITCYSSVPLRILSRGWGWICNKELPVKYRESVYLKYAQMFNVNIQEAASEDLSSYTSLCDFFCRPLKEGIRPIDSKENVVSPADGAVLNVSKVTSPRVEQVKGVTYSLETFLGEHSQDKNEESTNSEVCEKDRNSSCIQSLLKNKENALYQCVIYLAPGDYHRFHSPVDWEVNLRRHIQGELLSVSPKIARLIPDLFSLNERAVYIGEWKHGFFSFTAVGATNVGSIRVYVDEVLTTNERKWKFGSKCREVFLSDSEGKPLKVRKGDPFGEFRLGSTIILIFEAPKDFKFHIAPGDKIHVGQAISCNHI
ncbi:Phosphatidylserine decarboxylase proenzyme, mitochondrial [Gryllus bimaculatus]|nr:Phosphatidylserine decarboxylase proenzyme, mitochondrial [Gryllus bimaculatus]